MVLIQNLRGNFHFSFRETGLLQMEAFAEAMKGQMREVKASGNCPSNQGHSRDVSWPVLPFPDPVGIC